MTHGSVYFSTSKECLGSPFNIGIERVMRERDGLKKDAYMICHDRGQRANNAHSPEQHPRGRVTLAALSQGALQDYVWRFRS